MTSRPSRRRTPRLKALDAVGATHPHPQAVTEALFLDSAFFDPAKKIGPRITAALLKRGVIGRAMPQGDILGFAPPLCLTRAEADEIVGRAREAVEDILPSA